jgi:hypothetical protein
MPVSVKLEDKAKQTYAVYIGNTFVARGLPKAEANRISAQAGMDRLPGAK